MNPMEKPPLYPEVAGMTPTAPPIQHSPAPGYFNSQIGPQPVNAIQLSGQLGGDPCRLVCPYCHADIATSIKYRNGRLAHIVALVLCVTGLICCVCIPYCVDSCKDVEHTCPNCERHLGNYRR